MTTILRSWRRLVVLSAAAMLVVPATANATDQTTTSSPTGRLTVRSATLSITNVDNDGNPDSATNRDIVQVVASVTNNTTSSQRVAVTVAVDLAGSFYDVDFTKRIAAGRTAQVSFKIPIFRFFPRGTYSTSITADDGVESATATSVITLH